METSNAALYGKCVFTTIAVSGSLPWLWEKHWRRLTVQAEKIGIDLSEFDENSTRASLFEAIRRDSITDGRARITFSDERPGDIWPSDAEANVPTHLSIITGLRRELPDALKLGISPFPVNSSSPLAGLKTCNYLEQIFALDEAKARGFHEAVRVNERGRITSGCMSNIFWLRDGRLLTPSLTTGCLAGTTREYVLENNECEEVEADLADLQNADAIYLTSAGSGIARVASLDGRPLNEARSALDELDLLKIRVLN